MASFPATLWMAGRPDGAIVTIDADGVSLVAGDRPIGSWPLDRVRVVDPERVVIYPVSGDPLTVRLAETVRFAREVERLRGRRRRRWRHRWGRRSSIVRVGAAAGGVALAAVLVAYVRWLAVSLAMVAGAAAVLGGGIGLTDPALRTAFRRWRVTPATVIVAGAVLLMGGLCIDLMW